MQGWKLFKHAFGMVIRNWREALRIFLMPALLGIVALGLIVGLMFAILPQSTSEDFPEAAAILGFLGMFVVSATLATWCVVAWHRFVILEEMPQGWIPTFNGGQILAYWGQILKLSLVAVVVGAPAVFIVTMLLRTAPSLGIVFGIAAYIFAVLAFMRLSTTLPAAAIGKPVTFGEAFAATAGSWGSLFVLLLALVGCQVAAQSAVLALGAITPILGVPFSIATTVFLSLLNVSILTTLYGHYIEGRSID
ncbi:hypothetical protein J7399_07435 [Shimia sp. R9_1]|uniref:hypothetical protein n=1 Tax=Shimia sp. R9_1 TaxID=2821111 RepID=UPI001ADA047A|nr:hypothetical protein [Shimia sp. R9_1]MBO9407253.1 hypothetical protein [Shimia sp. R9_1]